MQRNEHRSMNRRRLGTGAGSIVILAAAMALSPRDSWAGVGTEAAPDANAQAKRWFEDARFGLFVHWGVYSLLGKGEWVMNNDKIPIAEYEKLPPRFNPVKFDADEWVKLAKAAGMKYITITSKHHDGFCMYDSKLTAYDIVDATPYGKDPMKALAAACHKQGIKLFFYYSLLDWHHPDYFPRGKTGGATGREEKGDWKSYVAYYQGQVRELCTNYGEIGGIWFDGWWDRPDADWDMAGTYKLIHELQPGALAGNNHHVAPLPGEDFQMFEQDLPGDNSAGFNQAGVAAHLPLETCLTMNQSWGYNARDTKYKTPEQVIHALVGAAGRGANLLLERGPTARWNDRAGIHRALAGGGQMAGQLRPDGLRNPARADRAGGLGSLYRQGRRAPGRLSACAETHRFHHPARADGHVRPDAVRQDEPSRAPEEQLAASSSRSPKPRERRLTPSSCSPRWGMAEALAETFVGVGKHGR